MLGKGRLEEEEDVLALSPGDRTRPWISLDIAGRKRALEIAVIEVIRANVGGHPGLKLGAQVVAVAAQEVCLPETHNVILDGVRAEALVELLAVEGL